MASNGGHRARENNPEDPATLAEGVEMSIVLAEAEPVGGYVGTGISEPILKAGILLAVGGSRASTRFRSLARF
ncbi:hypothetical protein [Rhizobium sp. BK661]|uniref:hypothetical protein n=1 Tax=Rhizobium sp. BK661 TaxID=2586991 RepID=UPI002168A4AA|nr:hypothetical protein [Rhizobium sp. BK661]MCS3741600.1 hypothetical protein [Rhizobium sp. BK661]